MGCSFISVVSQRGLGGFPHERLANPKGHDHNYERTKPLQGTTYLICGAGAMTRLVRHSDWTAYAQARLSFAAIEVYPNRLEIAGIGKSGQVFDRAEITNG